MKRLGIAVIAFALAVSANAQKIENALLWEVSGNGLNQPSYVFGTVKFVPSGEFKLDKMVKAKLKESKIFATETLLDHHSQHELNRGAHLPHHQSLEDLLTKQDYENLRRVFTNQLNVSNLKFKTVYSQFKPIVVSTTMTRLSLGKSVKYYEIELAKIANKNDAISVGLETVSREVDALNKFSMDDQVKALVHSINNFDDQIKDYNAFIAAYKAGDLHKTLEYTLHPSEDNQTFQKEFYDTRNAEWIPRMEKYMKEATSFFAIGAAHLADDTGVISLLRKQGYSVKPVADK